MVKSLFNFRGTTIAKAFFINAVIVGIISALTIETRRIMDDAIFNPYLPDRVHKVAATMFISTIVGMVAFIGMRIFFGTYAGTMDGKRLNYFI